MLKGLDGFWLKGKKRINTCKSCFYFEEPLYTCEICGCFLKVKTKMPSKHCPLGKWENGIDMQKVGTTITYKGKGARMAGGLHFISCEELMEYLNHLRDSLEKQYVPDSQKDKVNIGDIEVSMSRTSLRLFLDDLDDSGIEYSSRTESVKVEDSEIKINYVSFGRFTIKISN